MSLDFYLYSEVDVGGPEPERATWFEANITHNLNTMAEEAGIYQALWRPDEHGYEYAEQIVDILKVGLAKLEADPEHYKRFDAPNGWGLYVHFVPFVRSVYEACCKYPKAKIHAWR